MLHGAGSTATTGQSLLRPLFPEGVPLQWHSIDDRTGDVEVLVDGIDRWLASRPAGSGPRLVCGISQGAHAAAIAAAAAPKGAIDGLVLALPAWMGSPDETSTATALTAQQIARFGRWQTIEAIHHSAALETRWLVDVIRHDWTRYSDDELAQALTEAASGRGPTREELQRIDVPAVIIGATDDPMHPEQVARGWSDCMDRSHTVLVEIHSNGNLATVESRRAVARLWAQIGPDSHPKN